MIKQDPKKHHYIPCFYTKRWVGGDGKLCEFSRPHRNVIDRRKHPAAVGYSPNLYTVEGYDGHPDASLETEFFAPVDQAADRAIAWLVARPTEPMPLLLRRAFTGLLLSFLHRTPDRIEQIIAGLVREVDTHFAAIARRPIEDQVKDLPEGIDLETARTEVRRQAEVRDWAKSLVAVINSQTVGQHAINMHWYVKQISQSADNFLTSDKPLVHYNGVGHVNGNIALTLSPKHLFVATNNCKTAYNILDVSDDFLVRRVNHELCCLARKFVYGTSAAYLGFIERRLGKPRFPPDPPKGKAPPNSVWQIY